MYPQKEGEERRESNLGMLFESSLAVWCCSRESSMWHTLRHVFHVINHMSDMRETFDMSMQGKSAINVRGHYVQVRLPS